MSFSNQLHPQRCWAMQLHGWILFIPFPYLVQPRYAQWWHWNVSLTKVWRTHFCLWLLIDLNREQQRNGTYGIVVKSASLFVSPRQTHWGAYFLFIFNNSYSIKVTYLTCMDKGWRFGPTVSCLRLFHLELWKTKNLSMFNQSLQFLDIGIKNTSLNLSAALLTKMTKTMMMSVAVKVIIKMRMMIDGTAVRKIL